MPNLAVYVQDAFNANLYAFDTGLNKSEWDSTANISYDIPPALSHIESTVHASGLGISPNGLLIAFAAISAEQGSPAVPQYKIFVYEIGNPATVTGTIDEPNKRYAISATLLKEFTRDVLNSEDTIVRNVVAIGEQTVALYRERSVLDLQLDNDGKVYWLEQEHTYGYVSGGAHDTEVVIEEQVTKARILSLATTDSDPTVVATFLTEVSPNQPSGFEVHPIIIYALFDAARGRVFGRARSVSPYLDPFGLWWRFPADSGYATPGAEELHAEELARFGIFEENTIGEFEITEVPEYWDDAHTQQFGPITYPGGFTHYYQIPVEVLRDSLAGETDGPAGQVRRGGITTAHFHRNVEDDGEWFQSAVEEMAFVQSANGSVVLASIQDNIGTGNNGFFNNGSYPAGLLRRSVGQQYATDTYWQLRKLSSTPSTMAIATTLEIVSPDNPEATPPDYDVYIRQELALGDWPNAAFLV